VILRETHLAQRGLQAFPDDAAIAEPDLIDAGESIRTNAVSNAVDDEHPHAGQGDETLARPLLYELRPNHGEASEQAPGSVGEDAAE
jgi:hypothetical protein